MRANHRNWLKNAIACDHMRAKSKREKCECDRMRAFERNFARIFHPCFIAPRGQGTPKNTFLPPPLDQG